MSGMETILALAAMIIRMIMLEKVHHYYRQKTETQ
jgi:hypothetical protein